MGALSKLVDQGLMAADWAEALAPVEDRVTALGQFLREEIAAGRAYQPAGPRVFRAFQRPLAEVRVLIVGQDPYPNPAHPIGLCFAVERGITPLPPSLRNIYQELANDVGLVPPGHGDLSAWTDQGVMLLNRVLTVRPGEPGSHRGRGWEHVTACAIQAVVRRAEAGAPIAAILWGKDAQTLKPHLGPIPWVESVHPSPLSAHRGVLRLTPVQPGQPAARRARRAADRLDPAGLTPAFPRSRRRGS